jgi:hypothetical protein
MSPLSHPATKKIKYTRVNVQGCMLAVCKNSCGIIVTRTENLAKSGWLIHPRYRQSSQIRVTITCTTQNKTGSFLTQECGQNIFFGSMEANKHLNLCRSI